MTRKRHDAVTISYHYLVRKQVNSNGDEFIVPFTQDEFRNVYDGLFSLKSCNINDETINNKIRYKSLAVIDKVEFENDRFVNGIYKSSYWGHSYENDQKGIIPADSLNLRKFFFSLYFSENGRIYVATQYLGNFGGYTSLKNTVISLLENQQQVHAISYRIDGFNIDDAVAKRVKMSYSKKASSITGANKLGNKASIAIKRERGDDEFPNEIKNRLLRNIDKPPIEKKQIIKKLLKENDLIEVDDDEIQDCEVLVSFGRFERTIHVLGQSNFASRLHVDVNMDSEGHPVYTPLKEEVKKLLQDKVLSAT